jgi:hypothetical protein
MTGGRQSHSHGGPPGQSLLRWIIPAAAAVLAAGIIAVLAPGGKTVGRGTATASSSGGTVGRGTATAITGLRAWQASQQQYDAVGTVTYGSDLIVAADTGLYAYRRADGRLLWTIRPPRIGSAGGVFCGSGQNTPAGKLPVGIGELTDPAHHPDFMKALREINEEIFCTI